ncbi:MAG: hypothetical protein QOG67_2350 [Verrucomicrobiota bacterium]
MLFSLDLFAVGSPIHLQEAISYGIPVVHASTSPTQVYSVVFEDDGETGYFYARNGESIVDAVQIYTTSDRSGTATLQIAWSDDGLKVVAIIDRRPEAVFDFSARRGYSRANYPQPAKDWTGHEWDDAVINLFR